jgi:putative phosphoesterase
MATVTTLGILSDTHGYFHPALVDDLDGVDLILHAGDVGDLGILDGLEAVAPVRAVWGNVDDADARRRLPEHQRFEVDGLDVWMTHIAGRPGRWQNGMGERLADDPPDVFVCGHSHILRVERVDALGGLLYVNPGAAGKQGFHERKTCLRLRVRDGTPSEVDVIHLDAETEGAEESGS